MKKLFFASSAFALLFSGAAFAQDVEVPALTDVLSGMSDTEVAEMESSVAVDGSLGADLDIVVDAAVAEAITDGLITAEEAADATASLNIVTANAEFFDFDILDAIGEVIASGEFSMSDIRETLEGFNTLSDAGKAVVGQESFDFYAGYFAYQNGDTANQDASAQAIWNSLSAADQAIVMTMPVVADTGT